jgi:bisphosphoglycerate-dependent phosphoglycerate mutase
MSDTTNARLEELKRKYFAVFDALDRDRITLSEIDVRDNKLWIKGESPTAELKAKLMETLARVNPHWETEVQADIRLPGEDLPGTGQTVVNTSQDFAKQGDVHSRS